MYPQKSLSIKLQIIRISHNSCIKHAFVTSTVTEAGECATTQYKSTSIQLHRIKVVTIWKDFPSEKFLFFVSISSAICNVCFTAKH